MEENNKLIQFTKDLVEGKYATAFNDNIMARFHANQWYVCVDVVNSETIREYPVELGDIIEEAEKNGPDSEVHYYESNHFYYPRYNSNQRRYTEKVCKRYRFYRPGDCWRSEDKEYRMNNGITAVMVKGIVYACAYKDISEETLIKLGYKHAYGNVPLSNGEGYYNTANSIVSGRRNFRAFVYRR